MKVTSVDSETTRLATGRTTRHGIMRAMRIRSSRLSFIWQGPATGKPNSFGRPNERAATHRLDDRVCHAIEMTKFSAELETIHAYRRDERKVVGDDPALRALVHWIEAVRVGQHVREGIRRGHLGNPRCWRAVAIQHEQHAQPLAQRLPQSLA